MRENFCSYRKNALFVSLSRDLVVYPITVHNVLSGSASLPFTSRACSLPWFPPSTHALSVIVLSCTSSWLYPVQYCDIKSGVLLSLSVQAFSWYKACWVVYIDYFMVGECVGFLFTSCPKFCDKWTKMCANHFLCCNLFSVYITRIKHIL